MPSSFADMLAKGYGFSDPSITLGAALEGATVHQEPKIRIPLAMMNRHGLIAGATGTGKTTTLRLLTEQLSAQGVPVFVADMKGDLSGLAMPGDANDRITGRAGDIGWSWKSAGVPVEFVSLTGGPGVQLRAAVSSFGPLLLGKVLALNETQTSVLTMVFTYADDHQLLLLDLADLRAVLQFLSGDEGKTELAQYGGMSSASVGVLFRKMVELESQGAGKFFGEPEFDVSDMLHVTSDGRGVVTCLELTDVQDKPKLFSTFMMWMLAELYHKLPEAGDLPKPKLAFFFDEAHLLFDDAPRAFLDQIQQVVRLIRSKGVGVYLVTQTPKDVPTDVLAQLGNRIQHALRAHTPDDETALRATVRTFPKTEFYDLEETLTSLGIGEAVVTVLDARGTPTPVVATRLIPPSSRMAPLTPEELQADIRQSDLLKEYGQAVDRESAREKLAARLSPAQTGTTPSSEAAPASPRG
ncbi:MAG: helicase HerA-like domain-containing protein, partial [Gemmatimonadales bacterium]